MMQRAKMRNLLHVSIIYLTFVTKYRKNVFLSKYLQIDCTLFQLFKN